MRETAPSITDLEINPDAAAVLLPHLDTFVKWELLRFLHDNPGATATVGELARYIGRDETEVKPAARALALAGIARQVDLGQEYAYSLVADLEMRQLIGHLIQKLMADPLARLALSAHILKGQRTAGKLQLATR